jgi:asparagine synthase (glutamine-hydrolysing)
MCGICGFTGTENTLLLRRMNKLLNHRGPDDTAYYADKKCSLGMKRLSIIDLKKNIYPITNENQDIHVVYNGEIYNFKEITKLLEKRGHIFKTNCDGEVIVHAYEEWGEECVKRFNGMFAIAIWDAVKKKLILIRDRMGIKPLYYTIDNGNIFFASEVKSLLIRPNQKRELNKKLIPQYLQFRYVPEPQTLFIGIHKLPKASILVYEKGKHTIRSYWNLSYAEEQKSESQCYSEIKDLIVDSVKKRMISDVPLGIFLSGGVDSSLITAIVAKNRKHTTKTYSIGYNLDNFKDELSSARHMADKLCTNHKEIIMTDPTKILDAVIWHMDEPIADPAILPTYLLSKEARKKLTVTLVGEGADEVFGGYEQYKLMLLAKKYQHVLKFTKNRLAKTVMNNIPLKLINKVFPYAQQMGVKGQERAFDLVTNFSFSKEDYLKLISIFTSTEIKQLNSKYTVHNTKEQFKNINNMLNFDMNTFLQSLLSKVDKMTMAHSLEARVPFLDHRLVEYVAKIPTSLKLRNFNEKYILRKIAKDFIGSSVIKQKKQRFFVPIVQWLDGELGQQVKTDLLNSNFFNSEQVKNIFRQYNTSKLYYARQIWTMYTFEKWHKSFIEPTNFKNPV